MKKSFRPCLPSGFQASGIAAGIKKSGKLDVALFYSEVPARAAAVFTSNGIQAAPLKVCRKYLARNEYFQALIANSGNANCFTGKGGLADAEQMSVLAARQLGLKNEEVLVASTGIIARKLPLAKIKYAIPKLVEGLSVQGISQAKKAIMTTDIFAKEASLKFKVGAKTVTIYGVAKGAGMISPKLATLLCFIFTDANINGQAIKKALKAAADNSFNCITVDGCMSTNDMVMLLANGLAGNSLIKRGKNFNLFTQNLTEVCLKLAQMVVRDAEGASKFITIKVQQAKNTDEAKGVALDIANSNLFKTAMFAKSSNALGRLVAAAGASGIGLDEKKLKVSFSNLAKKEIEVKVALGRGEASATVYTSDLTYEYVKINAEYN